MNYCAYERTCQRPMFVAVVLPGASWGRCQDAVNVGLGESRRRLWLRPSGGHVRQRSARNGHTNNSETTGMVALMVSRTKNEMSPADSQSVQQTIVVEAPRRIVEQVLWPEFQELNGAPTAYLSEITEKVIREEVHRDPGEADEIDEPTRIGR